jgi:hypothetical protein
LPIPDDRGHPWAMGTKSREVIYGSAIRYSAERAKVARKVADRLAVKAWNDRLVTGIGFSLLPKHEEPH